MLATPLRSRTLGSGGERRGEASFANPARGRRQRKSSLPLSRFSFIDTRGIVFQPRPDETREFHQSAIWRRLNPLRRRSGDDKCNSACLSRDYNFVPRRRCVMLRCLGNRAAGP